jgi:hypothetical protein
MDAFVTEPDQDGDRGTEGDVIEYVGDRAELAESSGVGGQRDLDVRGAE